MRKLFVITCVCLILSCSPVLADDGSLYESPIGTQYQYDLSNPSDSVMYGVDPGAQIRDEINPMVEIDREMGVYGGGSQ